MKLCKNEYTIWASLKKLKSNGGNGQTGRCQNDQRWEMGDFCVRGSDLALSPQRPRFHPRSGTKILQAKQHIKKKFFFFENGRWLKGVTWGTYYVFKNTPLHSFSGLFSEFWRPFGLAITHASAPPTHSEPVVSLYVICTLKWRMTAV